MNVGYARISTGEQNLDLQIDALKHAGCEKIFTDTMSGSKNDRPGLMQMLNFVREGDNLVVWRLDRLGRSLPDLLNLIEMLSERKIHFRSLSEQIDTSSSTGKLVLHIFGAMAEFERNLIRERTEAGLKAARARGRHGGRPIKLDAQQEKEIGILLSDPSISVQDIAKRYGISRSTIYRHLKENHA